MKKSILISLCLLLAFSVYAQKDKKLSDDKLSKEDAASKTLDQRFVHDSNRKSKQGKKKLGLKKKVGIEKKTSRAAKRTRPPKQKRLKPKSK
jgi:hypothetical protein